MTNMQQLYANHLENVKHNREMERLTAEQNENVRKQTEEQIRHNQRSEELSQYQADVSAAASRYAAEKGAEGRIVSAATSADASKYSANQSREASKYSADTSAKTQRYVSDQNAEVQTMTTQMNNVNKLLIAKIDKEVRENGQAIESRKAWLDYLAKCGANQAALRQADAAARNANTNEMLAVSQKALNETAADLNRRNAALIKAKKQEVAANVASSYSTAFSKFASTIFNAIKGAKELVGGGEE